MPGINLGTSAYGTLSPGELHDQFTVNLVAGQQYEFRLHGIGANQLSDPYVRLYSGSTLVGQNDDASAATWGNANGRDSRLVFTAQTSGTYTIDVGSFNDAYTGDYLLTAVQANPQGMVFTNDEVAWQLANNFWEWSGPAGATNRQSGPSHFNVGSDNEITVDLSRLDSTETNLATWALFDWTMVTGINFRDVGASGNAEITFYDDNRNATGWQANAGPDAFASGTSGVITHSFVHIDENWVYGVGSFAGYGTTFNSYSFETYIHEIGHALGLGHAGNYDGSGNYGTDNYYLNDALAYSIMSYWQAQNDEFSGNPGQTNTFVPASFRYMLTPQPADIIAIRELYGLDVNGTRPVSSGEYSGYSANQYDNTYGFNSNGSLGTFLESAYTYGAAACYTIFDTAGNDTIDYSGYSGAQIINLTPEAFSSVNGGAMNLCIARGVTIENVVGGSGSDTITGNGTNNTFRGGGGTDTINGAGGWDRTIFNFASTSATFSQNTSTLAWTISGSGQTETLTNVEVAQFSDGTTRALRERAKSDFDGNNCSDILWRAGANGPIFENQMSGSSVIGSTGIGGDANWSVVGTGDFNGDGGTDLLWRYAPSGAVFESLMSGSTVLQSQGIGGDGNWTVAGTGDFNSDGRTDILWRFGTTGSVYETQMNGFTTIGSQNIGGSGLTIAGTGDFNRDGTTDILWRGSNGTVFESQMNGFTATGTQSIGGDANWSVVGTGDFNGDAMTDILWRSGSNGFVFESQMNGFTVIGSQSLGGDSNWTVAGTGDFSGDGRSDILWRYGGTGSIFENLMNGFTVIGSQNIGGDSTFRPLAV